MAQEVPVSAAVVAAEAAEAVVEGVAAVAAAIAGVSLSSESAVSVEASQPASAAAAAAGPAAAAAAAAPKEEKPHFTGLTLDERFQLCRSVGVECVQDEELRELLRVKESPVCYDGFEPSGRMHIAQGVLKSVNVNKLTKAGCTFIFWVADWFALMNKKMDGDIVKIKNVGRYMIEVWKACGMDMTRVKFLWSSEEINANSNEYWMRVINIATVFNLSRVVRCSQIMGRSDKDELCAAQIMYPCMQCADIFHLKADICQLGLDQRKVNMLAREYCDAIKKKFKPVILSHGMLPGLKEGQEKMSKTDPTSAIYMEDTEAEVNTKIKQSFCPPGVIEGNPCVAYACDIVLAKLGSLEVKRSDANGGNKTYSDPAELKADFAAGALHPGDLKPALAIGINKILQPVREHFATNPDAKKLLAQVKAYKITK